MSGKAAREYLAKHSNVLEIYCRVTRGQAIKLSGPTGKQKWQYPTWDDVRWVCERLDRKLIPDLTATQLTGEDGGPTGPFRPPLSQRFLLLCELVYSGQFAPIFAPIRHLSE